MPFIEPVPSERAVSRSWRGEDVGDALAIAARASNVLPRKSIVIRQ